MVTHTILVSDLSGEPAAATRTLGYAEEWHEVDLTAAEQQELEALLEPYLRAGRAVGPSLAPAKKRVVPETTAAERKAIRIWGREQGFEFADRGRIPKRVYNAYQAAHDADST